MRFEGQAPPVGDARGDMLPGGGTPVVPDVSPDFAPGPRVFARLTNTQFQNAISALFVDATVRTPLEQDTNPYLFYSIGAATTQVSSFGVEQYAEASYEIASSVFDDPTRRAALVGCDVASDVESDVACARVFLERFGQRAFRRPLTPDELDRWVDLAERAALGDPWAGLRTAVAGMLQSPRFLYRVEVGEQDPGDPTRRRFSSWEMASRLSFLIWNTPPDDTLLAAAGAGELVDEASLEAHARRMIADPRARAATQDFFAQYLDLSKIEQVDRDPALYPWYSSTLPGSMEMEVRLLVDDVVYRRDADVRELFSAPRGFVNSELAALYGVEAPGASPVAFVPVEFPEDSPRAGILTLGAFLAMNAHPTETSPTLRGKYLRERLFCQEVPPPPDDVDLNLDDEPGEEPRTLRERLDAHREDPQCAGCHAFIDPPGYLFDHFDSTGRWRDDENGHAIDTSGSLDDVPLADARDLADLLSTSTRLPDCMTLQFYRHAQGRLESDSEARALHALQKRFAASGYRFKDLVLAVALSDGFRTLSTEDEP